MNEIEKAVAAERTRIAEILSLEAFTGREELGKQLISMGTPADQARTLLEAAPAAKVADAVEAKALESAQARVLMAMSRDCADVGPDADPSQQATGNNPQYSTGVDAIRTLKELKHGVKK